MSSKIKVPFVDFAGEYNLFKEELDKAMDDVIQRGDLILREDIEHFESELAEYLNVEHVVTVDNGTNALFLTLYALQIGPGDEVITSDYTFRATLEAIIHSGAEPVLVAPGEDWTDYITANTKAVVPAHLEGAIQDWMPHDDIPMVEDSCQAIGARPLTGLASVYSFYPAKILGCLGDGGAVATNDDELAYTLFRLRNHDKGEWTMPSFNSRLDNLQAAVLRVRLKHLPQILSIRKSIAEQYDQKLINVKKPVVREVYQDYIVEFANPAMRNDMHRKLEEAGIQTMKNGYPFPMHFEKSSRTKWYEESSLRLPCNETLNQVQLDYVIEKFNELNS